MRKIKVDFEDYLSPTVIKAIAMTNREGFKESDIISFSEIDIEIEDRLKVFLNGTLFLIKKSVVNDVLDGKYNEDILTPPKIDDEPCEGDYCEN